MTNYNPAHPANASVIAGTAQSGAFGLHPDMDEHVASLQRMLIGSVRDTLNGWAALSVAENGVIFLIVVGTDRAALRLSPADSERALSYGAVRSLDNKHTGTDIDTGKTLHFDEPMFMGDDWLLLDFGRFSPPWCQMAYDYTAQIPPVPAAENLSPANEQPGMTALEQNRDQIKVGFQLARNGDLEGAIAVFSAIIDNDPSYTRAYFERAGIYKRQGRRAEEIADLSQVLQLDPAHDLAYWQRGDAWLAQNNDEAALADYQECVRWMRPEDFLYTIALDHIVDINAQRGNLDAAIAAIQPLTEDPDPTEANHYLEKRARLLLKAGNTEQAIRDLEGVVRSRKELAAQKPRSGHANKSSMKYIADLEAELNTLKGIG